MKSIFTLTIICISSIINAQMVFTDVSTDAGILFNTRTEGIAVGDYNNDGFDDFYACSPYGKNQLYRNNGDETFTEVGEELAVTLSEDTYSQSAVWGDINNDGWLDLYVANNSSKDKLFLNNGDATFTEISFEAGIVNEAKPKSVNMADINNDGFLDIYLSNFYSENALFLNNGDLTFTNYIYVSGALDQGAAMGSIFFDYDKDGDVDLYLVHDSYEPNFLYQNDGTGVFTEVGVASGTNTSSFGMGVDVADINHDGWLDIYIANLGYNFLLLNNGDGTFSEISASADVKDVGMGWGTAFIDYDNDSWKDIYVGNLYQNGSHPNVLYKNKGDLTFEKAEENDVICNEYGTHGVATIDFNLDGQFDLIAANRERDEQMQLFKNPDRGKHWIGLKLVGTITNHDAIGAKVQLTDNLGILHYQEVIAGQSWSSQNTGLMHFGLGDATEITALQITWTTGETESFDITSIDEYYLITENGTIEKGIIPNNLIPQNPPAVDNINILPNPNQGSFELKFYTENELATKIEVYNSVGQLLYNESINSIIGSNIIPIELKVNKNQLLILKVYNEEISNTQSILISK